MLTAQKAAEVLNEAYKSDPAAIDSLFCITRPCGKTLGDHPQIQVQVRDEGTDKERFAVGFIGLLNGMFLAAGSTDVVFRIHDDVSGNLLGFGCRPYADFAG